MTTPRWDRALYETFTDSPLLDAFGRLRTTAPFTIFNSKLLHDAAPLQWADAATSGAGTGSVYNANQASVTLSVSAGTAGTRTRRTRRRFNYQPGKSQQVLMTGILGAASTGITKRVGVFDDSNGLFFQLDGSGVSVGRRSNVTGTPVDTLVPQADWGKARLDGSKDGGPVTLNTATEQIFTIDYEWLGSGRVRFGFNIDGINVHVHDMKHSNILPTVYMSTPNLPLSYEIENDGTGGADSITAICSTIISEGGREDLGPLFTGVSSRSAPVNGNSIGVTYALVGLRQKAARLDTVLQLDALSVLAATNDDFLWEILLNPTVAGTFDYADFAGSSAQVAEGDTSGNPSANTVTDGLSFVGGFSRSLQAVRELPKLDLPLGSDLAGVRDEAVLVVTPLTVNADFFGSLTWRELQ